MTASPTPRSERLGLEPGSVACSGELRHSRTGEIVKGPLESELHHSIAISLKRIANAMERPVVSGENVGALDLEDLARAIAASPMVKS